GDLPAGRGGAAAPEPALGGPAAVAVCPRRGPPLRPALPPHPQTETIGRIGPRAADREMVSLACVAKGEGTDCLLCCFTGEDHERSPGSGCLPCRTGALASDLEKELPS